jgi:hypothetical protein
MPSWRAASAKLRHSAAFEKCASNRADS